MKIRFLGFYSALVVFSAPMIAYAEDISCVAKEGQEFSFNVRFDPQSSPSWARNILTFNGNGISSIKRYVWVGGNYSEPDLTMYHDAESGNLIQVYLRTDQISIPGRPNATATGFVVNKETGQSHPFDRRVVCSPVL